MAIFSCYVDVERFLGEPVKELAQFLCCLRRGRRAKVIETLAELIKEADHIRKFKEIESQGKKLFYNLLPEDEVEILWKLIVRFYLKPSENSSGKRIPQDDLIALRKGRLFEEIVFRLGPVKKWKVDLVSMHCQPMINRERIKIKCRKLELSGKNLDVVFWGKDYVEGYECKSNVAFYISLGKGHSEKARKVRDKLKYMNQLTKELRKHIREVHINLASFVPDVNWEKNLDLLRNWLADCGDSKIHFNLITIKDFLKHVD